MYSNRICMKDLFSNPALAHILPQFEKYDKRNDADKAEWVRDKVVRYLCARFGGSENNGEIQIKGNKAVVMRQLNSLKGSIEMLFRAMPSLLKNFKNNTPLYLPYENMEQIRGLATTRDKNKFIRAVLENVAYNPGFQTRNGERMDIYKTDEPYAVRQARWAKKVGLNRR